MTPVRNGHDARYTVAQAGNVLVEYGLIIGLVSLATVTSLMLLNQALKTSLISTGSPFQMLGQSAANTEIASSRPAVITFMVTLTNGKTLVLEDYPLDLPTESEAPIPSYQQSQTSARQLKMIADRLGEENILTEAQAHSLRRVSKQMQRIADIEKPLEDAYNSNTQAAKSLVKSTFKIQGKHYTLEELLELIRTQSSLRGHAPEIEELMTRMQEAQDAGALSDPLILHKVSRMIERIQDAASSLSDRAEKQSSATFEGTEQQSPNGAEHHVLGQNG